MTKDVVNLFPHTGYNTKHAHGLTLDRGISGSPNVMHIIMISS